MDDATRLEELKRLLPQGLLQDQLRIGWRLAAWLREHPRRVPPAPLLNRWLTEARASSTLRDRRLTCVPKVRYPAELPITARRGDILAALRAHPVLIVAGETGSGKSTQLPKMCLEAGFGIRGKIACTQPRRVAALSLSRRVAEELDGEWGREVGCKIRFSDQTSAQTYIKFMTDGMLLAEAQGDPFLSEYDVVILDEAHERSLNIDFLLGLLRQLLDRRDDLKLIITSATIDTQAFSRHFNNAPVFEVSGRVYPVEEVYAPFAATEEDDDLTYVDAAVATVRNILQESSSGDVLVFMPGERDILEAREALLGSDGDRVEVIPLFGRLSAVDQQRIFAPTARRKVVIATNIAETSLTVPGIRFVVDTGLARLSRYNPRTRTRRLAIEPISQSSANQRKGRSGRVAAGVCIRLYAEEDLAARPDYTQPEIQRANLAEVILRMKAFRLGDIETFPFLNAPTPAAIQGGYQLLQELGALSEQRELTDVGRDLARLPVDPTIGRMILQAGREHALAEVLPIAAGLSIQDPRERPADQAEAAAAAHRRFQHPQSDFLTLLNIWNAYHDPLEALRTQGQARKFCRKHFLSYPRMREWRDIHSQLQETLEDMGGFTINRQPATIEATHRAILTGLWSHVALRKERNQYQLGGGRQAMLFPGSGMFERVAESHRGQRKPEARPAAPAVAQPKWIVAGEIVETSRLFVRTAGEIDPLWIVELAPHLVTRAYLDPHWDAHAGRVAALERVSLNGLVVLERTISYGKVNPAEATAIFIRSALVEEGLADHFRRAEPVQEVLSGLASRPSPRVDARPYGRSEMTRRGRQTQSIERSATPPEPAERDLADLPAPYGFLAHNHQLLQKIEIWQTRLSHRIVHDPDEALFQLYARQLENVASVPDLNRVLRQHQDDKPGFLRFSESDLLGQQAATFEASGFPDTVSVGRQQVPLRYAYAPGDDRDGVTVQLPFTLAQLIEPGLLDWAVPGLRDQQILHLLQALPKALRRELMPLAPKAREMARAIEPTPKGFLASLIAYVHRHYQVTIPANLWTTEQLPKHLRPRYEILGKDHKPAARGRDLAALRQQLEHHDTTAESQAWQNAVQRWERYGLTEWSFGDLPEQILVADVAGFPLHAFPALHVESGEVCVRLFRYRTEADTAHASGVSRLLEVVLQRELAWLQKDLRALSKWRDLHLTLGPPEELETTAFENLRRHVLDCRSSQPRTAAAFAGQAEEARAGLPGLAHELCRRVGDILKLRHEALICRKPYPRMKSDLDRLIPGQFLRHVDFSRLPHLPRYLKAMLIRAERAAVNPGKDAEKLKRLHPYVQALEELNARKTVNAEARTKAAEFQWLIEEYRVSLFAQELGTAQSVSAQKLDRALEEARRLSA